MSETKSKDDSTASPESSAAPDQATKGAKKVDPLAAVEAAATKELQSSDPSFLDSLPPEQRRAVEKWGESRASKAVNDALRTKAEKGEIFSVDDVKAEITRALKSERERTETIIKARESFYQNLAACGITPGTQDYDAFTKEMNSGVYNLEAIGKRDMVERVAKAAQVGKFKPAEPKPEKESRYSLTPAGVSLKDINEQSGKGKPVLSGNKILDDARAMLAQEQASE